MSRIADDKVICMLAKRGSGKSYLVRDLMYHHGDIPVGTVVSPTENVNPWFGSFIPQVFIHDEYTPTIIENVLKRQKIILHEQRKEDKIYGSSKIDPRTFLILDDCLADNSWVRDKNMRSVFMNGRHSKVLFVFTSQYPLGIPPSLRTNIDFVFILRENIVSNRKRIYDHYAGMFPTFDIFCSVLEQCTQNHECLVIDNTSQSNKLEDQVFWYKANAPPDFKIGSPQFWLNNDGDHETEEEPQYDPDVFKGKKNSPAIRVHKEFL
jgi:hypothetical protein